MTVDFAYGILYFITNWILILQCFLLQSFLETHRVFGKQKRNTCG